MIKLKIKILFLILIIFSLTGCNNYYGYDFNSTSTSDCSVECEKIMTEHLCFEASPSYQSSFLNGEKTTGICSCYVRSCWN